MNRCINCQTEFKHTGKNHKYCSTSCSSKFRRKRRGTTGAQEYKAIVLSVFNNMCDFCGGDEELLIHHLIPKSKGGKDHIANIIVLCRQCHLNLHNHVFSRKLNELTIRS